MRTSCRAESTCRAAAAPALLLALAALAGACTDDEVVAPAAPALECSTELVETPGLDLVLEGAGSCAASVRMKLRVATGTLESPAWSDAGEGPVEVVGRWERVEGGVARPVTLRNGGDAPVVVLGLEWSTVGDLGLAVERVLHNGYQSWSYTGVELPVGTLEEAAGTAAPGGGDGDVLGERRGISWWWAFLSDAAGTGLVAGADGGTVLKTFLAADGGEAPRLRVVQGMTGDALTLAPGEERALDGLFVALGDVGRGLDAYAERVAALHPPVQPRKPALGGWGSWNLYYDAIDAAALRAEAEWAAANLAPLGLGDFLLDDGYEPHWGAWYAAPEFGADLAVLTAEQEAAGLTPAVWIAPVYVDETDPVVALHPEWFVHDASGAMRSFYNFGPTYVALEVTVPEARAFAADALVSLRAAGFRTLKLDFLFGAALEGDRTPALTGLEAYALWMKTFRDAVPDAHLVGCGAPVLPSVGWVDSFRTGPDIAFAVQPEPTYAFLSAEARHTALRAHTDRWWAIDPDVVLLRGDLVTDAEAWTHVVSAAMAGGNLLLGDGRQASPLRRAMALAPEILDLARLGGTAARAQGLAASTDSKVLLSPLIMGGTTTWVPHVWEKQAEGRGWTAVYAWDEEAYTAALSLPGGAEEILPPAADGAAVTRAPVGAKLDVAVPPHGVRLFTWPR